MGRNKAGEQNTEHVVRSVRRYNKADCIFNSKFLLLAEPFKCAQQDSNITDCSNSLSRRAIRYITEMQMLIQYGLVQAAELCADVKGNCFGMGVLFLYQIGVLVAFIKMWL